MKAIEAIKQVKEGNYRILKESPWLMLLWTKQTTEQINIETYSRLKDISEHSVLEYVLKTLEILEEEKYRLTEEEYSIVEEVLCWSEVAKCGSNSLRKKWKEKNYVLSIHNIGSAQIYEEYNKGQKFYKKRRFIYTLISTHGLIGQYLRGECSMLRSAELATTKYPGVDMDRLLQVLNKCIIKAVSVHLYKGIEAELYEAIRKILTFQIEDYSEKRMQKMRCKAVKNGENFEKIYIEILKDECAKNKVEHFLSNYDLWYVEAATSEMKLEEVVKLFCYIDSQISEYEISDVSFIKLMNLYTDHENKKVINLFEYRMIEKLLSDYKYEGEKLKNEFLEIKVTVEDNIAYVTTVFTPVQQAFIQFALTVSEYGTLEERQILKMDCEQFGFLHDEFDRLYNEQKYLNTMNESTKHKSVLTDYIVGDTVVDIGPGGGELMNKITEKYPEKNVIGLDVAENVIQELEKIRIKEKKPWTVKKGSVLEFNSVFKKGSVSSITFCSIGHELFSYVEDKNGQKFSKQTLREAFTAMLDTLPIEGRLIIRDGVMTASKENRMIRFKNVKDMEILKTYSENFKGRKIQYEIIAEDLVRMPINDAMEFLYTYTWGPDSFWHEVQEQFGYFTPEEYIEFLQKCSKTPIKIVEKKHFLQEGYEEHLLPKITLYNEEMKETKLPDSTIILVVEKC